MKNLLWFCVPRKIKWLLVVFSLLLAWTAPASLMKLGSLTACGCSFKNVTVLSFNATHVYFSHDGGITSLKLKSLDPKLQERFDYDPLLAAQAEKQQAED